MAAFMVSGFIIVIYLTVCNAALCTDKDVSLCHMMAKAKPDMCDDPCLANLCTRFCGKCPLICYNCHEVDDVASCQSIIQCSSNTEYCFTAQTFNDHFDETYKLGCAAKDTCLQYSSISHHKRVNVEAGCCNTDMCNNKPPVLLHIINSTSSTPTNNSIINRTLCDNLSDEICKRLSSVVPNMCSDHCISNTICPHMCGKCYNCLSCDEIESPEKCNNTVECIGDKECFLMEVLTHDFKPAVRLGCIDNLTCQKFHTSVTGIFGRRQSFTLQGRCCIGEKCNYNLTKANTLTTSNTPGCGQLSKCPSGFHQFDNSCYRLGETLMSKSDGKDYCRQRCSNLAEFDTTTNLRQYLKSTKGMFNIDSHTEFQAFVGIENINHAKDNPKWVWDTSGLPMANDMLARRLQTDNSYCMIAVYNMFRDNSFKAGLQNVPCNHLFKPLCQIKMTSR